MLSVGDERGAVESPTAPDTKERRQEVGEGSDPARDREGREVVGDGRVQQAIDGFGPGDARADEDDRHDDDSGSPFCSGRTQSEGDPERNRREGVPEVVDQVGEERHTSADDEDRGLSDRGTAQQHERKPDDTDTRRGPADAFIDQPVCVSAGIMPRPLALVGGTAD